MLFFLLSACSEDITVEFGDTADLETTLETNEVTFYEDVRPVLDRTCNQCHWESGRSFSMIDHTYPVVWASTLARDLVDGGKPPPTPDPTCADYVGGEWHLRQDDIDLIVRWVEDETPIGDPNNAPEYTHWPSIGEADQILRPVESFSVPRTEGYRCFAFETDLASIGAVQFETDNEELIHHSLLYLGDPAYEVPSDAEQGFDCFYSGREEWKLLSAWRPGAPSLELTSGVSVSPETKLIMQVYYTPPVGVGPQEESVVEPSYSWNVQDGFDGGVFLHRSEITDFRIPADSSEHREDGIMVWNGGPATIMGLIPRTHLLGIEVGASLHYANGGTECLLSQNGYDFGMPHNIMFKEGLPIADGDSIRYHCSWDNSDGNLRQTKHPPVTVQSGYGVEDAVCQMNFIVKPD
ncbi:MAG: hypothetical protein VX278_12370 [Myxococcota bacterium]|nr:hypothetical protein [Myxococcota bacterium]